MVYVTDNITPTTREKIDQLRPHMWEKMSIVELFDQRAIFEKRISYAYQSSHAEMVPMLQQGLQALDEIIARQGTPTDEGLKIT